MRRRGSTRWPPQGQAELLLERSINHYKGRTSRSRRASRDGADKIALNRRLNDLFVTSINSDDLTRTRRRHRGGPRRARISRRRRRRSIGWSTTRGAGEQGPRANALWDLGLLGNRGVDPARIVTILLDSVRDPNENIRYWAVEALAYLGTDATIAPLLEIFHDDPSPQIRERAACGLAQSGMLSAGAAPHRGAAADRVRRGAVARARDARPGCSRRCATSPARTCRTTPPPGASGTSPSAESRLWLGRRPDATMSPNGRSSLDSRHSRLAKNLLVGFTMLSMCGWPGATCGTTPSLRLSAGSAPACANSRSLAGNRGSITRRSRSPSC